MAPCGAEAHTLVNNGPPSPESSEDDTTGYLCIKKLPSSTFQQASTITAAHAEACMAAANLFYDNIRQNREFAHSITELCLSCALSHVARTSHSSGSRTSCVDKVDADTGTDALAMQFYVIELHEQHCLMGIMVHHSHKHAIPIQHYHGH